MALHRRTKWPSPDAWSGLATERGETMKRFLHRVQPVAQIRKRRRRRKEMKQREKEFLGVVNEIKKEVVRKHVLEKN